MRGVFRANTLGRFRLCFFLFHTSIPQSLANVFEKEIRDGIWHDELPGNRELAERYQLSRYSVLKALKILEVRGVVHPAEKGKSRKVIVGHAKKKQMKNLADFRKWVKSNFPMRHNAKISLTWVDGESVGKVQMIARVNSFLRAEQDS